MINSRNPVVSGTFYPQDGAVLTKNIKTYLAEVETPKTKKKVFGIIVPHAGYVYSGKCAAYAYKALEGTNFKRAVIIAPSHQSNDFYFSVGNYDCYKTPLGDIEIDKFYTNQLLKDSKFVFYPYADAMEHSLEVQLPFLQVVKKGFVLTPVLIGHQYDKSSEYLAKKLHNIFQDVMDETLFVVSTDLSHYYESERAEEMDSRFIKLIESFDTTGIQNGINSGEIEACGYGGILTLLYLSKLAELDVIDILNYCHSGMVSHDNSRVVGYLSAAVYK